MILEPKNIDIAYRCDECGGTVRTVVGALALSGDMLKLKCDCGGSELTINKTSDGKYRFTVPCVFCDSPHTFVISRKTLMLRELFTFPCPYAGMDILFIGDEKQVDEAIEKSDDELSELLGEQSFDDIKKPEDEEWGDAHLQDLILFSLGELAEDDAIKCDCPDGGDFVVTPHPDRVEIACKKCGCKREISCEEGSIGAHVLFDCDTFRLLPPDDNKEDK